MPTSKLFGGAVMAALAFGTTAALADEPESGTSISSASTTTTTQAVVEPVPLTPPPVRNAETTTLSQKIRPNRPLLVTGGVLLVGAYVPTAILTATNDKDRTLYIPVAGPWLSLAGRTAGTTETALVVSSGIVQDAGALLALASLFVPERIPAATIKAAGMKVNVVPTSYGAGSAGVGAVGTF